MHQHLHQRRTLQLGKGRSAFLVAAFAAVLIDRLGVGQAKTDPVDGHQPPTPIKGLRTGPVQGTQQPPEQFLKNDKGQRLSPLTQGAVAHLDAHQPKQMFGQAASPSYRVMKQNGDQQLRATQLVRGPAGLVFAGLQPFDFFPGHSPEQQGHEPATVGRRLAELDRRRRR